MKKKDLMLWKTGCRFAILIIELKKVFPVPK